MYRDSKKGLLEVGLRELVSSVGNASVVFIEDEPFELRP